MHRLGTPDEVAKIIYVLCTETSSYVNGAEIHINGGQHVSPFLRLPENKERCSSSLESEEAQPPRPTFAGGGDLNITATVTLYSAWKSPEFRNVFKSRSDICSFLAMKSLRKFLFVGMATTT